MARWKHARLVWLGLGLARGIVRLAGLWPNTPLHAVATDRNDTFAMATGRWTMGSKRSVSSISSPATCGAAPCRSSTGQFHYAFWGYNVNKDLGVDPAKNPRYMMVTGIADLRRTGGAQRGRARASSTWPRSPAAKWRPTAIPWSPAARSNGQPIRGGQIKCLDVKPFRTAAARGDRQK